jgi:hypothetical protein
MKTRERFLKSTINYWLKNSEAKAYRQWVDFTLKGKEAELSKKL